MKMSLIQTENKSLLGHENKSLLGHDHYSNLSPPLAPNDYEVGIFKKYVIDSIGKSEKGCLLLGFTKELIHLADEAVDINPPPNCNKKIRSDDWFNINQYYDVIIGDGCINMVGGKLIDHLSQFCGTLVIRFFMDKLPDMKYATRFRHNTPFLLPDVIIETQPLCKILIWYFKKTL